MRGLLLKDLYTLGKQMKFFLALTLVFSVLPGYSMSAFAIMYAAMLPMSALAYDERAKWNTLASMMPYSPTEIVFGKYLLGYISTLCVFLLSIAAQAVIALFRHTSIAVEGMFSSLAVLFIALLLQAIDLPILFKLGVERGRLFFLFITVMIVMVGVGFRNVLLYWVSSFHFWGIPPLLLALLCVVLIILLNAGSIFLSVKLYKSSLK